MKKHIAQHVQSIKGYKGRLIYADLFMKGWIKLRIIQIYVHASALKKTEILELYEFIYNLMNDGIKNGFYLVLMGDFNADLIKYNNTYVQQSHVPWKFLLTKYLNDTNYIETYSLFHDINAPTWNRNDLSACLDQIWISPSLQMDILHADILSPLIYDTDHKIVTAQFITSGIFSMPTRAVKGQTRYVEMTLMMNRSQGYSRYGSVPIKQDTQIREFVWYIGLLR